MNFASKLLSAALLTCIATPLFAEIETRIIGGVDVDKEDWPSMAAILFADDTGQYTLFDRQFCGGNLINKRWIVSAAHCFFDEQTPSNYVQVDADSINVVVGIDYLEEDSSTVVYDVERIIVHGHYDPTDVASQNDIALLELKSDAPNPVMDIYTGDTSVGTTATVIGWGATQYDPWTQASTAFPKQLKGVDVPLVSNTTCRDSYGASAISSSQLCAGEAEGGVDSCQGDSGGPLMISENGVYKQAGIVSFGNGCALADFYGVYTRTSSFTGWISAYVVDGVDTNSSPNAGNGNNADDEAVSAGLGASSIYLLLLSVFGMFRLMHNRLRLVKA